MQLTAKTISQMLGGTVEGDPETIVFKPGKIEEGEKGSISFLANLRYEPYLYTTKASVVLIDRNFQLKKIVSCTLIRVDDVYTSIAKLLEWYEEQQEEKEIGIAEVVQIHPSAQIGKNIYIGSYSVISKNVIVGNNCKIHSQVYIGKGVEIGENTVLKAGVKVYAGCKIGDYCTIHANTVIGADGFGFAPQQDGSYSKVAQIGNVVIEDQVEIGANSTIDRATFGSTFIRKGVKIDNLVQIAHNVEIGENTVIAAQAGVAGSTKIGKNCMIGGQVGFAGHLTIADGAKIQAQSGIASNIKEKNAKLFGSPAISYNDYIKSYAVFKQLPKLYKKIYELEKKLEEQKKGNQR